MCQLCSNNEDEVRREREHLKYLVIQLERVTKYYRGLASGSIKPHQKRGKTINPVAKTVIRLLVEDWV